MKRTNAQGLQRAIKEEVQKVVEKITSRILKQSPKYLHKTQCNQK